jgi:hypothetical protein
VRGLPPDPAETVRLSTTVDVNGSTFSFAFSWFVPGIDGALPTDLEDWLDTWIIRTLDPLTGAMHAGASALTCRLGSVRPGGPSWEATYPQPNHGHFTGGQADQVAVGLYVKSSARARGSGSRIRLPACPDEFIDDNRAINTLGLSQLQQLVNAITMFAITPTPFSGVPPILGTIQRQAAGRPLTAATFAPTIGLVVSRRVETIRRRLPKRGQVSPP